MKQSGTIFIYLFFFAGYIRHPDRVALLQEGELELGADLVSFFLLLLEVFFELVRGETHFGVAAFV